MNRSTKYTRDNHHFGLFIGCWIVIGFLDRAVSYDGYTTCSKPFRTSRGRPDYPCDFKNQNWCIIPGSSYPWHAVRRFVYENHGLMRRMYGEQRHISVLRAEIDSNDVDYSQEGWQGYHESPFKKYAKPTPTPLRQASASTTFTTSDVSASTLIINASSAITTNSSSSDNANATTTEFYYGNSTNLRNNNYPEYAITYNVTDNDEEREENESVVEEGEDVTSTEETLLETTTTESTSPTTSSSSSSLPLSLTASTMSSIETMSRTTQPQIYQETPPPSSSATETPIYNKLRGINACPVKQEVVAPFWANNTRGEILALLNLYPFEQYVHWERCTYENRQMYCRQGCRCEQQYRLHRLLAYDPTDDCRGIFSDWFKFPSCCVCKCYDLPLDLRITSRSPRRNKDDLSSISSSSSKFINADR